jgi:hypothetical protein
VLALILVMEGACSGERPSRASGPSALLPPTPPPRRSPSPPPNSIVRFEADRTNVQAADTVTLSWVVTGIVDHCTISTGIPPTPRVPVAEDLLPIGKLRVRPRKTTWYALTTYLQDGRAVLESDVLVVVE